MRFEPKALQAWTNGRWSCVPSAPIENFYFDTRIPEPKGCFLAIRTDKNDGHQFLKAAEQQGASAAIVEHCVADCPLPQLQVADTLSAFQSIARAYRATLPLRVFALTGSCGKTTAKELLALLLGEKTFKSPGNFNTLLGIPYVLTHCDPGIYKQAVLEVGIDHMDTMQVLANMIQPDVGILLNVNQVHMEFFPSIEAIAQEKIHLLHAAKDRTYCPQQWVHLLPASPNHFFFTAEWKNHASNAIFVQTKRQERGWTLTVNQHTFEAPFLLGTEAAQAFAMMLGVGLCENIAPETLQARLLQWKPLPDRGAWKQIGRRHYYVDCYNANPKAFENSLEQFYNELAHKRGQGPVCYCIGSMLELGKQSAELHRRLARLFHIYPHDTFICIGSFAKPLADGFLQYGAKSSQICTFETTAEALPCVAALPHSCIYLKGSHFYHLEQLMVEPTPQ